MQGAVIKLKGRGGGFRDSPIDAACKTHDIAYNWIDEMRNPVAKRIATINADRQLLKTIAAALDQNVAGKIDLNAGEVIFAQGVQVAFQTKLVWNGIVVATELVTAPQMTGSDAVRTTSARASAQRFLKNLLGPYIIVYQTGPKIQPFLARLYNPSGR